MAVNSKADKVGSHKVRSLPATGGMPSKAPLTKPAYSSTQVTAPPAPAGMSQMGGKALALRAKKVLEPDSNPNEAP